MRRMSLLAFLGLAQLCFFVCPARESQADLVLHYQAELNANDSSAFGNHGALNNGTTYGQGMFGNGFVFDGINDTVEGPPLAGLDPSNFTIAMWAKTVPGQGLVVLADSSHGGNRGGIDNTGFAIQMDAAGRIDFAFGNNSTFPHVTSDTVITDGDFYHIAATLDGSTMSIYIDGVLENSIAYTGTPTDLGRNFRLGNHDQFTSRSFEGTLDDVRVYNESLTSGQIASLAGVPEPSAGIALGLIGLGMMIRRRVNRTKVS